MPLMGGIAMNPVSGLYKLLLWPICRIYAKYVVKNKLADTVMRGLCIPQFWRVYGFFPNFSHPEKFSEKLWHRMLFDRDPRLTMISDNLRVRDYVAKKAGRKSLVPLLWNGDKPEEIPFEKLPSKFVIKTNHGGGYVVIVQDKMQLDQDKTRRQIQQWLNENYCEDRLLGIEWGYKNIKPTIIIESFLDDAGKIPVDYKFYCFAGRLEVLTLHFDRFEDHKTMAFDSNLEPYNFGSEFKQDGREWQLPANIDEMIKVAESLSEDFDFMRVDLYSLKDKIYFGELTPYPGGTSSIHGFDVKSLDSTLGKKWKNKHIE